MPSGLIHSGIKSLQPPPGMRQHSPAPGRSDRLPNLAPGTRQVAGDRETWQVAGRSHVPHAPHAPPKESPRSVRGLAQKGPRRRPAPLLQPTTSGNGTVQPTPPSIPSSHIGGSPWDNLPQYGGGWMSSRTPRVYNGLAGPSPLAAKFVRGDATPQSSGGPCPHCERMRLEADTLKRQLKSQRQDFAALAEKHNRLDEKLLRREREEAARSLIEAEHAMLQSIDQEKERQQDLDLFGMDQLIADGEVGLSLESPASPPGAIEIPLPLPAGSPVAAPVRPAPMPNGATEAEKAWVAAAETEGFVMIKGPALLGDGQPWGKKRLNLSLDERRCIAIATRSAGHSPISAQRHYLLVRPPSVDLVEFEEAVHAIPLSGCAIGCTTSEAHPQCGRLRVLPAPSTTMVIPGGSYVEELYLSSLKIENSEALAEMKEWTALLQPLTFE